MNTIIIVPIVVFALFSAITLSKLALRVLFSLIS